MQVVAVTGAGGYLGRSLVRQLTDQGVQVRAITRGSGSADASVIPIVVNVLDAGALASPFTGVDAVMHLVAHSHDLTSLDDAAQQESVTLGGTVAALKAAERANVPAFIFASSVAVHGPVGSRKASEDFPCKPTAPYGRAKLAAERAVVAFAERTGAKAASIRPAVMYGARARGNVPRMIRAVQKGLFPPIPEFGNRRSMVSVDDAAAAMILAWRRGLPDGRPFIVTDGRGYSTREMFDLIRAALGRRGTVRPLPRSAFRFLALGGDLAGRLFRRRMPFDTPALERLSGSAEFDDTRARRELGYASTQTFEQALPDMLRHLGE